jgi:hypothetical protein
MTAPMGGTRFRLFPAYAAGYAEPETIEVSPRPGEIGAGPSDPWMYAVHPLRKDDPYDPPSSAPPFRGPAYPPALPGPHGHFDHIPADAPEFLAAHLYGTVRHTLDIWEFYLGRKVVWWHAPRIPRLELIPFVQWQNAHSGPGFIEMGEKPSHSGREQPFCLNFDVIAHETGHAILFSMIGVPEEGDASEPFLAFHESFSDLIALIGVMEIPSVSRRLLTQTGGNLYVLNIVNRIGAISDTEQVRLASNTRTMADVVGLHMAPDASWNDPTGQQRNQHAIAEPLTGAVFDALVELYQDGLAERGLIAPEADARGWTRNDVERSMDAVHACSAAAFARFAQGFHAALDDARHVVARCMSHVILTVRPETLSFPIVAARFLEAAAALGQARHLPALLDHFLWRGIDPRPVLGIAVVPGAGSPRLSRGRLLPWNQSPWGERRGRLYVAEVPHQGPDRTCCDPRAYIAARRLMSHAHRAAPA